MVKGNKKVTEKDIRNARNVGPARSYAALQLTGAYGSATGWGLFDNGGKVDLFAEAAKHPNQGENPFNTWLTREARPIVDTYPAAIGIFFGEGLAPASYPIKSVLAENMLIDIKDNTGASVLRQTALTMPSGLEMVKSYSTADTAGADKRWVEMFGPSTPAGLFRLRKDAFFPESGQLRCLISIAPLALAELKATVGNFPSRGAQIGIVVYGRGAFKVSTTR
jgi:hypothetical protein